MQKSSVLALIAGLYICAASSEEVISVSTISLEVQSACRLDNGAGGSYFGVFIFGSYFDVSNISESVSTPGGGSIGIVCSPDVPYQVEIDYGLHMDSSMQRRLFNSASGQTFVYELFQDAAFMHPWNPTNVLTGVGTGNLTWLTIYGRVPGQSVIPAAGEYRDQLGVTLTF